MTPQSPTVADDDRPTCPRCGRRVGTGFGGRTLMPHKAGKGGPECEGSRMAVADVEVELAGRREVGGTREG